ncbi:type III pantothenate kinase [bacterium]|nr:type III pantothenate kinase [bacterium]
MILALDVGNSHIFGGLFVKDELQVRFRRNSKGEMTSDELGVFLRAVIREWGFDPVKVRDVAVCSVVPEHHHAIQNCALKYFQKEPFFLRAGVKTGLKILCRNPAEVGADRIAAAVGAAVLHPGKNLIVTDFGTATTLDVIRSGSEYLGGLIMPGLRTAMESLVERTAKLPPVEIVVPENMVGRGTVESIQSGLYYSHYFAIREMMSHIRKQEFAQEPVICMGTGGFSRLFEHAGLFDDIQADLVLQGLYHTLQLNRTEVKNRRKG